MSGAERGGLARLLFVAAVGALAGGLWQAHLAWDALQLADGLRAELAVERAETQRRVQDFAALRAALADAPDSRIDRFEVGVPSVALALVDGARRLGLGVTQRVFVTPGGSAAGVDRGSATDTGDGLLSVGFALDVTVRTRTALHDWFAALQTLPVRLVAWRQAGEQAHVELLLYGE